MSDASEEELDLFARLDITVSAEEAVDPWSPLDTGRYVADRNLDDEDRRRITPESVTEMAEALREELGVDITDPNQLRIYMAGVIVSWQVTRSLASQCKQRDHVYAHLDTGSLHVIKILNKQAEMIGVRPAVRPASDE